MAINTTTLPNCPSPKTQALYGCIEAGPHPHPLMVGSGPGHVPSPWSCIGARPHFLPTRLNQGQATPTPSTVAGLGLGHIPSHTPAGLGWDWAAPPTSLHSLVGPHSNCPGCQIGTTGQIWPIDRLCTAYPAHCLKKVEHHCLVMLTECVEVKSGVDEITLNLYILNSSIRLPFTTSPLNLLSSSSTSSLESGVLPFTLLRAERYSEFQPRPAKCAEFNQLKALTSKLLPRHCQLKPSFGDKQGSAWLQDLRNHYIIFIFF